ncbi:MAG: hypothetical protein COA52_10865 [Hyphomicrobiales bacterium]|nr:MAG: hypothetical protein COA52_10865 [Hyphomicrobiales bacterium]
MIEILLLTIPVYLLVALGYAAVRSNYVTADSIKPLGLFVVRICVPVLIFGAVTRSGGGGAQALNWSYIGGYLLASLIVQLLGTMVMWKLLRQSLSLSWISSIGISASNSIYFGLPIASMVFGDIAISALAWCIVVEVIVIIPLALTLADTFGRESKSIGDSLINVAKSLATNPLVLSLAAAMVFLATGWSIPGTIQRAMDMLVAVAPGAALFVVGGTVASYPINGLWKETAVIGTGKLIVHPILAYFCLSAMPGLDKELIQIGVLFASVPMLTIFPIFAQKHGGEMLASTSLIVTTVASFVTVNILMWMMLG